MKKKSKIPQEYKRFVIDCCRKAAWNIGVSHFKIDIHYMDEPNESVRGEMSTNRRYLQGIMKLYPMVLKLWNDGEKEQVKETIYHEVAHFATQHFYDVATARYCDEGEMEDAWEACTEVISRMALLVDKFKNE